MVMAAGQKKKKEKPKLSDKEESERFKKTVREFGVDESGKEFERTVQKPIPPKWPVRGPP
jgi:hypothetical protein